MTRAAAYLTCATQAGYDIHESTVVAHADKFAKEYRQRLLQEQSDPDELAEAAMGVLTSLADGTAKGSLRRDYEKLCPKAKQKDSWWRAYAAFNLAAQQAYYDTDDHENVGQFADQYEEGYAE